MITVILLLLLLLLIIIIIIIIIEVQQMWNVKVKVIPVIIRASGTILNDGIPEQRTRKARN
jgi:hypothetical protein